MGDINHTDAGVVFRPLITSNAAPLEAAYEPEPLDIVPQPVATMHWRGSFLLNDSMSGEDFLTIDLKYPPASEYAARLSGARFYIDAGTGDKSELRKFQDEVSFQQTTRDPNSIIPLKSPLVPGDISIDATLAPYIDNNGNKKFARHWTPQEPLDAENEDTLRTLAEGISARFTVAIDTGEVPVFTCRAYWLVRFLVWPTADRRQASIRIPQLYQG